MDAPPIQYARTEDGVNIAYWTLGEGPLLVYAPSWATHAQAIWDVGAARELIHGLAEHYRVLYFDPRGIGMSDEAPDDVSLTGFVADFNTVLAVAGAPSALILAEGFSAHAALHLAVTQPTKVSGLALFGAPLAWAEWTGTSSTGGFAELMRTAKTKAQLDAARQAFVSIVDRVTVEEFQNVISGFGALGSIDRALGSSLQWDASQDAAGVAVPTVVLARREDEMYSVATMRTLAAAIPDARLLVMPGKGAWLFDGDPAPIVRAIRDLHEPRPDQRGSTSLDGLRTLLFTDLESSTALTQQLGDAKAQEILNGHNEIVRAALQTHAGEEIKHTGDGIFAAFTSAVSAVEASLQIQRDLAGAEVRVRIGLNAGEPIAQDDDYFGAAVQLAARVCDRAEPGQILVAQVVRDLCRGKTFHFDDQGEATLKGFPEPVRLFVVADDQSTNSERGG